jgi:hypothetical protein
MDVRASRCDSIMVRQNDQAIANDNELAYATFESFMALSHPGVIVVCQCMTYEAKSSFTRSLCSPLLIYRGKWNDIVTIDCQTSMTAWSSIASIQCL